MELHILSNLEIKDLVDTIPKILRFDYKDNFKKSNDKNFTIFEQLPEEIQLKISIMANSPQLLRTKKHYLEIGKQTYYDLVCTNMGPSFGELINYVKQLPKNIRTKIGLTGILYDGISRHIIYEFLGYIELSDDNKTNIYDVYGLKLKTLLRPESLIDYFILKSYYRNDYSLVSLFFDLDTISGIVSNRKRALEIDPLYVNKFVYSYAHILADHFVDYFGLAARTTNLMLYAFELTICKNIHDDVGVALDTSGTYFFFTKNGEKEEEIRLYTLDFLEDISGPNYLFVDNRFLSITY